MKTLAMIPARGGSKRIPRKNIKNFLGEPIIKYSIEAAKGAGIFDEIMVSTDDEEISRIAKSFGASVPFLRAKENSGDFSKTADVALEVLSEYKKRGIYFDRFACIYPAAPFIKPEDLKGAMEKMEEAKADSVAAIVRFGRPIERAFRLEKGFMRMIHPSNISKRSQDFPPAYCDAGQFYCLKTDHFLKKKEFFTKKTVGFEMPESRVQDIDNLEDWRLAEIKYNFNNQK
ncbi:MAG: pseudaminic acid cytidylyltransferase [Candidatus Paceibacterota bacterium]